MTNNPLQVRKAHPKYKFNRIDWMDKELPDKWYVLIDYNNNCEQIKRMAMTRESAKERNTALAGSNLEWRPE